MLGSDEGIKLESTDGKLIGPILGNIDGTILGLDVGTYMVSLDASLVCFNGCNLES